MYNKIMSNWVVITSINSAKFRYLEYLSLGWNLVVVGDLKSGELNGEEFTAMGIHYLSLNQQKKLYPNLSNVIGSNTYARKNIGYLYAISLGAEKIFDTDDDTFLRFNRDPLSEINSMKKYLVSGDVNFFNPYLYFAPTSRIWPRGYPLNLVEMDRKLQRAKVEPFLTDTTAFPEIDIVQTLVNLEPDVDAIYRLVESSGSFNFEYKSDLLLLDKNIYSPGNSQSTFWLTKRCQGFLYIPRTVDFRFCDILRMYVAQSQNNMAYAGFFTEQYRNQHNLMADFESELSCYLRVEETVNQLREIEPGTGIFDIYTKLLHIGIVKKEELKILSIFLENLDSADRSVALE
jgi:hypothetical protein